MACDPTLYCLITKSIDLTIVPYRTAKLKNPSGDNLVYVERMTFM